MTTVSNEFAAATTTNATQLHPFNRSPFTSSNADQQCLLTHKKAQMEQLQSQQMQIILQQQLTDSQRLAALDQMKTASSNSYSTINQYLLDTCGHVNENGREEQSLSPSPPSPADSGVVADSKSEGNNTSQDLLQNLSQSKFEEGLNFMNNLKNPDNDISFGAITSNSGDHKTADIHNFSTIHTSTNSLGLCIPSGSAASESAFATSSMLSGNDNNSTTLPMSRNIAAIWQSAPAPSTMVNPDPPGFSDSSEEVLFQALKQSQLNGSWGDNGFSTHASNVSGAVLQKQLLQQRGTVEHIQALRQQLLHSQSNPLQQMTIFNRSTSHQPGGSNSLNTTKMNGFIPVSQTQSHTSWSADSAPMFSAWPTRNSRSTLFNSLQHSSNASKLLNGTAAFHKRAVPSQIAPAPRLNRSISTPAKHSSYINGVGMTTSLDDNPFFKMSDSTMQNGALSLMDGTDNMGLSSLESQLYDIIRSNENSSLANPGFPRSSGGFFNRGRGRWTDLSMKSVLFEENPYTAFNSGLSTGFNPLLESRTRYSRKVFVGGLPPDIDEDEIQASFRHFGPLQVDWPHKAESKSFFPPKGYAFLLFNEEISVQNLISCCMKEGNKLYICVSSPTIRDKPVQIRPWNLADSDYVLDGSQPLDPRKTIFVGGVPRPLRAVELAMLMDRLYGGVCYAGIDVDPELKYPKGAGRVAFASQHNYIAAISARFVQLQHGDIDKRVEVKPYVLDDQHCDECHGSRCGGKFAPFFCANVTCLQYYCEHCWTTVHAIAGRENHKPLVKEGADRSSRSMPFRW